MRRVFITLTLLLFGLCFFVTEAESRCTCVRKTLCEDKVAADLIFEGYSTKTFRKKDKFFAEFEVKQTFKGKANKKTIVRFFPDGPCPSFFAKETSYLVFARKTEEGWRDGGCSGSRQTDYPGTAERIAILSAEGKPRHGEIIGSHYGIRSRFGSVDNEEGRFQIVAKSLKTQQSFTTKVDRYGNYRFLLPFGKYEVRPTVHKGLKGLWLEDSLNVGPTCSSSSVGLAYEGSVSGVIEDTSGQRLDGASVYLSRVDSANQRLRRMTDIATRGGKFQFSNLPKGKYQLGVCKEVFEIVNENDDSGASLRNPIEIAGPVEDPLRVRVRRKKLGANLLVRILDNARKPVFGALVTVTGGSKCAGGGKKYTNNEGVAEFSIAPGYTDYKVAASKELPGQERCKNCRTFVDKKLLFSRKGENKITLRFPIELK